MDPASMALIIDNDGSGSNGTSYIESLTPIDATETIFTSKKLPESTMNRNSLQEHSDRRKPNNNYAEPSGEATMKRPADETGNDISSTRTKQMKKMDDRKNPVRPPAKRRICSFPGCNKTVKSKGRCMSHGGTTPMCKVTGCEKQAQGGHDGMCKLHFREKREAVHPAQPPVPSNAPLTPEGESVYDRVIPESLLWDASSASDGDLMPLVAHLKDGFDKDLASGWHRNEERRARGLPPVHRSVQLEGWERDLIFMEVSLLSGNKDTCFRHLARAWARDRGFQRVLARFICKRGGDPQRKKRTTGKSQQPKNEPSVLEEAKRKSDTEGYDSEINDHDFLFQENFLEILWDEYLKSDGGDLITEQDQAAAPPPVAPAAPAVAPPPVAKWIAEF